MRVQSSNGNHYITAGKRLETRARIRLSVNGRQDCCRHSGILTRSGLVGRSRPVVGRCLPSRTVGGMGLASRGAVVVGDRHPSAAIAGAHVAGQVRVVRRDRVGRACLVTMLAEVGEPLVQPISMRAMPSGLSDVTRVGPVRLGRPDYRTTRVPHRTDPRPHLTGLIADTRDGNHR